MVLLTAQGCGPTWAYMAMQPHHPQGQVQVLPIKSQVKSETLACGQSGYENWLWGHECHLSGREGAGANVGGKEAVATRHGWALEQNTCLLFYKLICSRVRRGKKGMRILMSPL